MKIFLIFILGLPGVCFAQEWQAEFFAGAAGYNGDLTQKRVVIKELRPAFSLNLKYNSGDYVNFRLGVAYGRIGANDQDNKSVDLRGRNLNFKSDIYEVNLIAEINLFDPDTYTSYPYVFGGVGLFHFDPFTFDSTNKKTFLSPLSTEGEGLVEYPSRKKYSLTQICLPVGIGWKMPLNEKWDISYEIGYRLTFTDYLDDVSKTYVNLNTLGMERGQKAVELSYRNYRRQFPQVDGLKRGDPSSKDIYFFGGIKISTSLSNLFGRNREY
jgi:Domain of unknown function (DUF6089)